MAITIGTPQPTQAVGFNPSALQGVPQNDPRQQLVGRKFSDIAKAGSTEQQMLGLMRQSLQGSTLSLRDLPPDVAQQLLDGQNKSINEFLKSWSDSIAECAKRDVEAEKRRHLQKQTDAVSPEGARRLFGIVVAKAVGAGLLDRDAALDLAHAAGAPTLDTALANNDALAARAQALKGRPAPNLHDALAPPGRRNF